MERVLKNETPLNENAKVKGNAKSNTTKFITLNGIGIALFVVLTMCLQVPVFENYYLCLGYVAMMVYCYKFGPASGSIVGTLGVVIYCVIISGLRGMPGWTLGNLVIGIICGTLFTNIKKIESAWARRALMAAVIIASTAIGILGVKSLTECLLYAQPMLLRIEKNSYAFIADIVVMLVSIPVCEVLEKR
jgi:ECF transporter S component (folate family)